MRVIENTNEATMTIVDDPGQGRRRLRCSMSGAPSACQTLFYSRCGGLSNRAPERSGRATTSARRRRRVAHNRGAREVKTPAEREMQIDALDQLLGAHAQERDARRIEGELLLLHGAEVA